MEGPFPAGMRANPIHPLATVLIKPSNKLGNITYWPVQGLSNSPVLALLVTKPTWS